MNTLEQMAQNSQASTDHLTPRLAKIREHGYEEHFFTQNLYKNPETGATIDERMLHDPEQPERLRHFVQTSGRGKSKIALDDNISTQRYILAYMIDREDQLYLLRSAEDETQFCNAVAQLGYEHDFAYGVDYTKEDPDGTTTHINESIEPTKHSTERVKVTMYRADDTGHREVTAKTFDDHLKALDFIHQLMEEEPCSN